MSIKTKLEIFTLRIREKGNRDNYLPLNDIAGFNLLEEINSYIQKNIYLFKIDNDAERTYRIDKNEMDGDSIYSRIKVGKFGETSEIVDTLSGSGVFHKEREHSDTIPLYFHIKGSENKAHIALQRTNNRTLLPEIKSILTTVLNDLREDYFSFDIKPLQEKLKIKSFLKNGEVSKIELSAENNLGYEDLDDLKITIKSKPRKPIPQEIIDSIIVSTEKRNLDAIKSITSNKLNNLNITGANIEVRSKDLGSIKYSVGDDIYLNTTHQIPTTKEFLDKTGHPAFPKLKEFSSKILK